MSESVYDTPPSPRDSTSAPFWRRFWRKRPFWLGVWIALTVLSQISVTLYAAFMTNIGADLVADRAAVRGACADFVVARASLDHAGVEMLRVLESIPDLKDESKQEVRDKVRGYDDAAGLWARANAQLLLVAGPSLEAATNVYNSKAKAAIKASFDYYYQVADALKKGLDRGTSPRHLWQAADAASVDVENECRAQLAAGSFFWP